MRRGRKNTHWASGLGYVIGRIASWLWDYRLELGLLAAAVVVFFASTSLPWYVIAPLWLATVGVIWRWREKTLGFFDRSLFGARIRRQVVRAARDSGFSGLRVDRVVPTLPGELVEVRVPRGLTVAKLDAASGAMASCLRVSDVRVIHDRQDRSQAAISILRRDPFELMTDLQWPWIDAESVDIRHGVPAGHDEYGRMVTARLLSRNLILGGSPDAGKSTALRVYAAAAALDPRVKLWMMDAKTGGAEFIHWTPAAEEVVCGRNLTQAVEMLARIEERLEKRGQEIVRRGEVFVCDDMELDVLMIDELPQFTRGFEDDDKEQTAAVKSIREGIWRLIALGRWTGMMTILSAQKPTANIVPTESRDLIDNKFALHCNTKAQSRAILGGDSDDEVPADATDIPSGQPGVGYYVGDHGVVKMRSFYISHKQAMEIASRVAGRSMDDELAAL